MRVHSWLWPKWPGALQRSQVLNDKRRKPLEAPSRDFNGATQFCPLSPVICNSSHQLWSARSSQVPCRANLEVFGVFQLRDCQTISLPAPSLHRYIDCGWREIIIVFKLTLLVIFDCQAHIIKLIWLTSASGLTRGTDSFEAQITCSVTNMPGFYSNSAFSSCWTVKVFKAIEKSGRFTVFLRVKWSLKSVEAVL